MTFNKLKVDKYFVFHPQDGPLFDRVYLFQKTSDTQARAIKGQAYRAADRLLVMALAYAFDVAPDDELSELVI